MTVKRLLVSRVENSLYRCLKRNFIFITLELNYTKQLYKIFAAKICSSMETFTGSVVLKIVKKEKINFYSMLMSAR